MTRQAPPEWWVDALTKVVYGIRENVQGQDVTRWAAPGIRAAILRVNQTVGPADTVKVMAAGADNPKIKTPGGIAEPGPQWADTTVSDRPQPKRCATHKLLLRSGECPECVKHLSRNRPANFDQIKNRARHEAQEERDLLRRAAMKEDPT